MLKALPKTWEVCYLGFHTGDMLQPGNNFEGKLIPLRDPRMWLAGLWGYLVSRRGADRLLREAFPISMQIDALVGKLLHKYLMGGYAVPPGEFLLFSPPTEDSRDTDVQTF